MVSGTSVSLVIVCFLTLILKDTAGHVSWHMIHEVMTGSTQLLTVLWTVGRKHVLYKLLEAYFNKIILWWWCFFHSCSHFSVSVVLALVLLTFWFLQCWTIRPLIFPPTVYWESCFRPPTETLSLSELLNTAPPSHDNIGSSPVCVVSFHFHKTKYVFPVARKIFVHLLSVWRMVCVFVLLCMWVFVECHCLLVIHIVQ